MTIKELERLYHAGRWTEELQEQCRSDSRTGVRKLVHRWERETQERARVEAMYHYEFLAREKGCTFVAGVDEAGRGPLAGPVVVAAVILPLGLFLPHLNDSKKLSAAVREELFSAIMKSAVAVEIVSISEKIIDERNIYQATKQGMYEAVSALRPARTARCRALEASHDVFSHCPRGCKVGVDCGGVDCSQGYERSPDAEVRRGISAVWFQEA